jgi:DNA (cytosine-5)-methyltransferase 1
MVNNKFNERPKVIDLFSGCGGLSLGFVNAGFDVVLATDIWEISLETHKKNLSNSKVILGDICKKEIQSEIFSTIKSDIDVIVGGPPCQGFSSCGLRLIDDPRNSLFKEFVKMVNHFRPSIFLMENVWNLPLLNGGIAKDMILDEFKSIGYSIDYQILLAADYGVPQMRKRCVFIGNRFDGLNSFPGRNYSAAQLFKKKEMSEYVSVKTAIGDLPPLTHGSCNDSFKNHCCRRLNKLDYERISFVPEGGYAPDIPKSIRPKENKRGGYFYDWYRRLKWDEPSRTIIGSDKLFHPDQNRKLSVRECARLQSFPDSFEFFGSLNQQYKQIGNAVPPMMAFEIAKSIKKDLEKYSLQQSKNDEKFIVNFNSY